MVLQIPRTRFIVACAVVFAGLCNASLAAAETGAASCPSRVTSQPFLRWGDANQYALVTGGDFESALSGWTLSGGAQRAAGSEPYAATGVLGSWSLALPAGATAQTPYMCMSPSERTFRFFDKAEGGKSTILASVVYKTPLGAIALPVGALSAATTWAPSPQFDTGAALAAAISGGTVQVAIRLTALSGAARVDDVFLDPRMHH